MKRLFSLNLVVPVLIIMIVLFVPIILQFEVEASEADVSDHKNLIEIGGIYSYNFDVEETDITQHLKFGRARSDEQGRITGYRGVDVSLIIGYFSRYYFEPIQYDEWNFYGGWGTRMVLAPYLELGSEYIFSSGFSAGVTARAFSVWDYWGASIKTALSYRF